MLPHEGAEQRGPGDHGRAGWLWCGIVAVAQRGGHAMPWQGGRSAVRCQGKAGLRQEQRPYPCKDMQQAEMAGSWLRRGRRMPGTMPAGRGAGSWQSSPGWSWPRSSPQSSLPGIGPPSARAVPLRRGCSVPAPTTCPRLAHPNHQADAPGPALRPGTARCSTGCCQGCRGTPGDAGDPTGPRSRAPPGTTSNAMASSSPCSGCPVPHALAQPGTGGGMLTPALPVTAPSATSCPRTRQPRAHLPSSLKHGAETVKQRGLEPSRCPEPRTEPCRQAGRRGCAQPAL